MTRKLTELGSRGHRGGADIASAEKFKQQNHLVLAVGDTAFLRVIEALDAGGQLRACPAAGLLRFEDASSQKLGYVLQFVR